MRYVPVDQLAGFIGQGLGASNWLTIDQARIDLFAEATGDHQFIHVDPARAAATPYGSTIAHGLLSLSLIPYLMENIMVMPEGLDRVINYGLENVRYLQPVPVNAQVRLRATLLEASEKRPGQWLLRAGTTLEIHGQEKPALVAEPLFLCFV
jgi:acyl dehydratase